ncbi:DEAD/DEAH box helicase [Aliarcobacter cryaerophilus]|uniref:DEAD/DEAH box helicase n=2 Tax=unclassified Arcobacter TaxID=2593671 RepID=A0AA96CMP6_9BACT|nr:DEAD/DEAH box helicase [Arcobacter sp. AZ-2023]WPD10471.1 DEAD/DEAH box helicase [Arcobacter sp. DSM 115954]WNL15303.1 DEAD/DEAH box helicase [Arcobacter sp. AZ-2023]WNL18817.1 DEAD/DEAH box helicase [Arcobacter sp. AZ-2023]WNL20952.1 DEAD/DEAH box helicase [Arcobacter sp. AZ-2023]
MTNIIEVNYQQTGESKKTNSFGMRDMQAKAFEKRNEQYLLLKAPPASGKSRALMFIALDKLYNQGIKKVIVAVPERSIGGSFGLTNLKKDGFFTSWEPNPLYNLCIPGGENSKVEAFKRFMLNEEKIVICTHATLRFAFKELDDTKFNNCLLAIDEFHHVSADGENQLGELIRNVMQNSTAHIVAMTGSYFRGDSVPVLLPEDEAKFSKVTYNYYEQLNGYEHLKSLGIGYHFYQGKYTSAIADILDTNKKTILHIPNVNSGESTKDKHKEVDTILDIIGTVEQITEDGIILVKRASDGKILKVADLVNDDPKIREKVVAYLRNIKSVDDMDLIIALGMAKEGFDWPYCEHALTVGYRSSLTEIIQIIGRATRDSDNKTHAQFTNLIAQPDAQDVEVKLSVNNMLKAITASLLMEQVLAPNFKFKPRFEGDETPPQKGELKIRGFKPASSKRVEDIIESDLNDLKATILQDEQMIKAIPGNLDAEVINRVLIPKIIKIKYPDLTDGEVEEVRQHVVIDSVIKNGQIIENGDKKFIKMADKFVNIDDLHIDLIDQVNPFQKAFEILSKSVTTHVLKLIQESIESTRIEMTPEEAVILYKKIPAFKSEHGRMPDINSRDFNEKRMAESLIYLNKLRQERANANA